MMRKKVSAAEQEASAPRLGTRALDKRVSATGQKVPTPELGRSGDEQNSLDRWAKSAGDGVLKPIDEPQRAVIVAIGLADERYARSADVGGSLIFALISHAQLRSDTE